MKGTKTLAKKVIAMMVMVIMVFQCGVGAAGVEAEEKAIKNYDMSSAITDITIQAKVNNQWYTIPQTYSESMPTISKNAPIKVAIAYEPSNLTSRFNVGDTIYYDLPNGITITQNQYGDVYDGPTVVGNYVINTDGTIVITVTNNKYIEDSNGKLRNGTVSFDGKFNGDHWGSGGKKELVFGKIDFDIKFEKDQVVTKAEIYVDKSQERAYIDYNNQNNSYIEYKIRVYTPSDNTDIIRNVTVKDVFTQGGSYLGNIYDVQTDIGRFDTTKKEWTGIGDMAKGQSHTLRFKVRVNSSIFNATTHEGSRTIKNKAEVYANGTKMHEEEISTNANSAINIEKSNSGYVYDKNSKTSTVTYTVRVTADANNTWPIQKVTVWDVFGDANKSYIIDYESVNKPNGTTTTTDNSNKKLFWNIGTMNPGDVKELTYTVEVDDNIFLNGSDGITSRTINNTATYYIDGNKKDHDDSSVEFRKVWIWKNGTLQSDGRVKFVIHANESTSGAPVLTGPLNFSDRLGGDWVYDGNVVVKWYDRGPDNKGTARGQDTFNVNGQTSWTKSYPGGYYYEFEYYARYTGSQVGTPSISNHANIGIGVGGTTYNHYTEWSGTSNDYNSMTKHFVSRNNNIATWQSKITTNIPAGAVYTDWRDGNHEWTFTDAQISAITVGGAGAGKNVTIQRDGNSGFKITFNEPVQASKNNPITIDYSCTLRTDNVGTGATATYKNKGKLQVGSLYDTATAQCTYTKEQRLKKEAGGYDENKGIITWNITANVTGSLSGEATITDELPAGLEYYSALISARGTKAGDARLETQVSGQTVTMKLTNLKQTFDKEAYVTIQLKTKVVDKEFLLGNGSKTFNNSATLEYYGDLTTSSAIKNITNTSLTKTGTYDENTAPNIHYTINVNPKGLDMLKDASTIKIEDKMSSNLMLKSETLLIKDKDNNVIQPVNLTITENKFSFDVPDNIALTITYKAYVLGEVGDKVSVDNTVSYYGEQSVPGVQEKNEVEVAQSKATIQGAVGFYIVKKDAHDTGKLLQGTEFTLYKVDDKGGLVQDGTPKVADANGIVSFVGLDENTVYAFNETKAKEGYLIDDANAKLTFVAFSNAAASAGRLPEGLTSKDVMIIQSGVALEKYNEYNTKTKIKFSGSKTLSNANYSLTENEYEFTIAGPNLKNASGQIVSSLTVGHDANGNIRFPEIRYELAELDGKTSKTYEYTIKEKEGTRGGIVYSEDEYNVKVTVTKNDDGTIGAAITDVKKNGETVGERTFDFINNYEADDVTTVITGQKKTVNHELRAEDYTFQIKETTADVKDPFVATAKNDANGYFTFVMPKYTLADHGKTFTYEVSEVKGDKLGITYDKTVYTVTVNITDQLNGELKLEKTITVKDETVEDISFTNSFKGSVELTKTNGKEGDAYRTLEGAKFALYKDGKLYKENLVTGEKGKISVENLPEGDYYFVETAPPAGHRIVTDASGEPIKYEFQIGPNGGKAVVNKTIEIANEQKLGELSLIKKDEESSALINGAVFSLYKDGEVYQEGLTTDEKGAITVTSLPWGEYYFVETAPAPGYVADATPTAKVVIDAEYVDGEPVTVEKTNEKKVGSLSLIKKDVETAEVIEGATFALYKDGALFKEGFVTDKNGKIEVKELPWGEYYFVETAPAAGYVADATPTAKVVIDAEYVDGEPVTVDKTNKQTEFYITKTDINGEKYLIGSTVEIFKVIKEETQQIDEDVLPNYDDSQLIHIATWTSDGSNHLIKGMLEVGETYIIKETAAPTGYGLLESYIEFTVDTDGSIISNANFAIDENGNRVLLVQDDIIDLKVTKTDYVTGVNLEGAVLAIFDKETGEEVVRWTSTKEGHYDFGAHLTANKTYILRELQAPEGYEKIDDVEFKVLNEGQIEVVTVSEYVTCENGQMEIGNCPIPPDTPDTGDHTPLGMSMILMTLAMIGMISAAMPRKRRTH